MTQNIEDNSKFGDFIPSDPAQREKLRLAILDQANQKTIAKAAKAAATAAMSEAVKAMSKEYNINAKYIRGMINSQVSDFKKKQEENEQLAAMVDIVMSKQHADRPAASTFED